jgi:ectoine hydroxylase-related dioxygenase (phytanoyl-CoA dioxygenase family)
MNDNERYLFDLQGYITVENALEPAQLAELNRLLDEHIANECDGDMCTHRFGGLLDWGEAYRDLIDNGAVVPYLTEVVDPKFRLDHVYADIIRSGTSPIGATLHGGSTPFNPSQYYRFSDGRMHNGLSVVAYNLADVGPEDGGFGCVPGSHKSNYSLPGEWRNLEEGLQPCVRRVTGAAGSAIIFTEALSHGALPWSGAGERRTVFFKYSPHPLSWAAGYYDDKAYDGLSEGQRDILEAPNARYGKRPR